MKNEILSDWKVVNEVIQRDKFIIMLKLMDNLSF